MSGQSVRLLLDEDIGVTVADGLRQSGFDIISVLRENPGIADREVMAWANRESRIIVTLDRDFGFLVHRRNAEHAGVLYLRLRDESPGNVLRVLKRCLVHAPEMKGRFVRVTEERIVLR